MEMGGSYILTDPVLVNKFLLFRRQSELGYDLGKLPELSAILISHAHHDHLDLQSFKYIRSSVPVFVPVGLGSFVGKFIRNPVIEIKQWAKHTLPNGIEITATQAEHTGCRIPGLGYKTCNGYIISNANERIFFAGDTGPGTHFEEIGKTYNIDTALLPIAGFLHKSLCRKGYMNPEQALAAFKSLNAKRMIPIHHGTFKFLGENTDAPAKKLAELADSEGMSEKVFILKSGEKIVGVRPLVSQSFAL